MNRGYANESAEVNADRRTRSRIDLGINGQIEASRVDKLTG